MCECKAASAWMASALFLWMMISTQPLTSQETTVLKTSAKSNWETAYSAKELGAIRRNGRTLFRLFAPRATSVILHLYRDAEAEHGERITMHRDADGVWEAEIERDLLGFYYSYSVDGPRGKDEAFDPEKQIADPYSRAVASRNEYQHRARTLIVDMAAYDWEGDVGPKLAWEDLIIYECHLRDMTAHPSSGADPALAGSYRAFIQPSIRGGINHIKALGCNAVEFLPLHEFGNIEIPYQVPVDGVVNTWNPYARNHWGYMTSYFFAPESYYASGESLASGKMCGVDGRAVNELRDVVKALHREGIAVILDVVYNHVSQYDWNCFKLIDKKYYFRLNPDGSYTSVSGCGNDFKTESPMGRRMILDSIRFWMEEYHIDGFRFDLAAMIDAETCDEIYRLARQINPNVILIAEPWGGGYAPAEFSRRGWAAWNDQFRNGVKGQNPYNGQSFIFGRWFESNSLKTLKRYVMGSLAAHGGLFVEKAHSVNYLESHDDHTLGDFIRIGLGGSEKVDDPEANARLTPEQLRINKLAALILFTSQGPVMIHEGQEWARSKVIAPAPVDDPKIGWIDHNSYNKDNETNWLNYQHADWNRELVDYYRGLIALRKAHPAFRRSRPQDFKFLTTRKNPFALGFLIRKDGSGDTHDFIVLLNGHREKSAEFSLPRSRWTVVADESGSQLCRPLSDHRVQVPPSSGMILQK